ncbi:MAG: DNA polymerase III subunit gamma/tau [Rickettsiales bacterium]|nr:DNA polymerase III subunit gamma/tau [Rickettsiales bacterium]
MTENYTVLARKYRPQTFSEVIGQDVLIKTLTNAIEQNKIHHAFILTGIRGVGKTTTARLIAKSLNCIGLDGNGKETVQPCLQCSHCKAIANGNDQDVIEFDAASHTSVNDIRDIIDSIGYAPVSSRYKIYIIDEVHMLSNSAFNALLKTLEEPPAYVKFIFATTEIRKVPITILSRCIRFDLNRVPQDVLSTHIVDVANKEGYNINKTSANIIANSAEGSVRDSMSLLDRIISFNNFSKDITEEVVINILGLGGKEKIYSLYENLINMNTNKALEIFEEIYLSVTSVDTFLNDLLEITHILLMKKNKIENNSLTSFQQEWLNKNYNNITLSSLFRVWQFIIKAITEIKNISNYKSFIEVLILKICYGINIPEINDIIKKLKNNSNDINLKKDDLTSIVLNTFNGSKIV